MKKEEQILNAIFITFICVFVFFSCLNNSSVGDTYFMLSHGKWIFSNGLYPVSEMLTMHEGLHFTIQKWLSCIIYYKVYLIGGELAIRTFVGICSVIMVLLLKRLLRIVNNSEFLSTIIVFVFSLFITKSMVPTPRIFTYILLIIELMLLEKYKQSHNNYKYLIPIPLLVCLCMNLHSTQVIIMFIFMLPYIFDFSFIKSNNKKINNFINKYVIKENYQRRNIIICFFISLLFLIINPYGFESIVYIINSTTLSGYNSIILELQPVELKELLFWGLIFGFPFIIEIYSRKKIHIIYTFFLLGTFFMYAMFYRNFVFLAIASSLSSTYFIDNLYNYLDTGLLRYFVSISCILLLLIISIENINNYYINYKVNDNRIVSDVEIEMENIERFITNEIHNTNPSEDINKLKANTNVYVYPPGGSYLEFKGFKSFFDCRSEVFYKIINKKADIQLDYYNLIVGVTNYKDFFKKYNVDYIITTPSSLDAKDSFENDMLNDKDYKLVFETDIHKVFIPINKKSGML